jgi:REP element-mobilizing transposase RayT
MRSDLPHRLWHRRGYIPHFDGGAVVQTITFRLNDSLPRQIYAGLAKAAKNDVDRRRRLEAMIDEGRGACRLAHPHHAEIVQTALKHFDGQRYRLLAWVIMPNHVHAAIEQVEGHRLGDIIHSWKSFTANQINSIRKSAGAVWAPDYFDRYIRDEVHFTKAVEYIEDNPVKAGLAGRAEDWAYSSASARVHQQKCAQDARGPREE